ncbi:MAG: hypothetical protein AVDCRST_MAG56-8206 [uncultured Cytophagales bacterium]|uniref:Uncharacterized protein n=1 Tax=uncultured Cytophagales bacterium TaxID=158755 RepID=A0A6J4M2Y9_9SPHI|nr:MAG: hypothetical protein AVDCRST_MAG56-8206 [uncultured Cytophagales bacterium]
MPAMIFIQANRQKQSDQQYRYAPSRGFSSRWNLSC